jgi:AraC-like DNA-binding protein/ligand-binding sensor protein
MDRRFSAALRISRSKMLADYEAAFAAASGLPLQFEPVVRGSDEASRVDSGTGVNPFCALLSKTDAGCRMCLDVRERLRCGASEEARTEICIAGLADTAVPVVVGGEVAGYLRTGQVALSPLKKGHFTKVANQLMEWGEVTDLSRMEEAWFHSRVLKPQQYEAFVQLLKVFARHLSLVVDQSVAGAEAKMIPGDSPVIQRAKDLIESRQQEDLSVGDVAKMLNISVFYFCKVFRKATGLTFTEYLAQVRVAKARNLLQNPHVRISEVAFEVGFQSITHFNRSFRKLTGESPTAFRSRIWATEPPKRATEAMAWI